MPLICSGLILVTPAVLLWIYAVITENKIWPQTQGGTAGVGGGHFCVLMMRLTGETREKGHPGRSSNTPGPQLSVPMPISLLFSFFFPVCTQLLVSRPDEENISSYLQLIDKCLIHEVSRDGSSKTVALIT